MKAISIKFHLNRYNILVCRVSDANNTKDFSTKIDVIQPLLWDVKAQRIKPTTAPENDKIEAIRYFLKTLINRLDSDQKPYNPTTLVDMYLNPPQPPTLASVLNQYLNIKEKQVDIHIGKPRILHLRRYNELFQDWIIKNSLEALFCRDFRHSHADSFIAYCRVMDFKNSYINTVMFFLRSTLKHALETGQSDRYALHNYPRLKEPPPDTTCLDNSEYEAIKELKNLSQTLEKTRDMLLFMAGMGIHIGDYLQLTKRGKISYKKEGMIIISYNRTKTEIQALPVLKNDAIAILNKYGNMLNTLPRLAASKYNEYLKILGEKIGTPKNLTSKVVGRKTFTDRAINVDILPLDVVSKQLGLSSTQQLKHYGKIEEDGIVKHVLASRQNQTNEQIKSTKTKP